MKQILLICILFISLQSWSQEMFADAVVVPATKMIEVSQAEWNNLQSRVFEMTGEINTKNKEIDKLRAEIVDIDRKLNLSELRNAQYETVIRQVSEWLYQISILDVPESPKWTQVKNFILSVRSSIKQILESKQ